MDLHKHSLQFRDLLYAPLEKETGIMLLHRCFPVIGLPVLITSFVSLVSLLLLPVRIQAQPGPDLLPIAGKPLFANGINAAWNHFGTDVGRHASWGVLYDSAFFDDMFREVAKAGGNSVRWWLHCDGRSTPEFDSHGIVTGLDVEFFDHFDAILRAAVRHTVKVMPVLWSFDMANDVTANAGPYGGKHIKLITDTSATQAYIHHVLTPLIRRYKGHAGILAWEICNEPEWMLEGDGSTLQRASALELQRWHGLLAGAIHREDPTALVTTGSASFKWNWDNPTGSERNLWSDSALIAASGDPKGFLDFYQVHYYSWMRGNTWTYSPFDKPASFWKLDKPVMVGEFPALGETGYKTSVEMHRWLADQGYTGSFSWTYKGNDEYGKWSDAKPGVESIAIAYPQAVRPEGTSLRWPMPLVRQTPHWQAIWLPQQNGMLVIREAGEGRRFILTGRKVDKVFPSRYNPGE